MREVLVIGGSRYFGRGLIGELRQAGMSVTVLNRGSAPAPEGVTHLIADRDDERALSAAVAGRRFDVVVDQVCYTAGQAAIARRVFEGRTGRYVMTSTIEVYAGVERRPYREDEVWREPASDPYGEDKRRAEAELARGGYAFASVRAGHVLGGGDFTGRLAHYAERIRDGRPVVIHADPGPSSFIHEPEIARFLAWAARGDFTGPVNACSNGPLDVRDLCAAFGAARFVTGGEPSPFSFARPHVMDNARATALGFTFSHTSDWIGTACARG
ncbi:NAD-dependent epimerase/dehydratase family protein [Nonomuraea sp. NBC_01738]|uniref:NAD-dependent epimerase/dehydratase family protein n=1 Tax=Nonomuraea sp. NBC_01738 TaxID=2976003 RepID=UPI002E155F76|nr:NAD-dependent epimerase/dehydratase family protein [Nonomuraea sp. NBC_01738]